MKKSCFERFMPTENNSDCYWVFLSEQFNVVMSILGGGVMYIHKYDYISGTEL